LKLDCSCINPKFCIDTVTVKLLFMAKVLRRLSASLPPPFNPSSELFHASPIYTGAWKSGSLLPPDRIDSCLRLIVAKAPEKVVPFNINCRSQRDRWSIRGIRINKDAHASEKTNVVLVSGQRSKERSTIGINLSVAAMIAEQARRDVSVSVVPNMDPREYERLWRRENAVGSSQPPEMTVHAGEYICPTNPVYLSSSLESSDVSDGYLQYYIKRLGNTFSSLELNFSPFGATIRHKKDVSLSRQCEPSPFDFPSLPHSQNLDEVSIPISVLPEEKPSRMYVIELRDRNNNLEEDHIAERADQVITALQDFLTAEKRKAKE